MLRSSPAKPDDVDAQPVVSVVVPCLNRAAVLVPTLESILAQDYPHVECIVVDGGSNDGTLGVLSHYVGRIRWISEPDHGPAEAINKGWRMSRGAILAWLNAGDLWRPETARYVATAFSNHPDVDVIYGDCGLIDAQHRIVDVMKPREWDLEWAVEHCDHIIHQPAAFIRRQVLVAVGWLDESFFTKHDHDLWLRIGTVGKIRKESYLLAFESLGPSYQSRLGLRIGEDAVRLTRKFLLLDTSPAFSSRVRRRALSNAYLVGARYAWHFGGYLGAALSRVGRGFLSDPTNVRRVAEVEWQILMARLGRYPVLFRLLRRGWKAVASTIPRS